MPFWRSGEAREQGEVVTYIDQRVRLGWEGGASLRGEFW